jgi:upstream activation factor subunit UAF30
MATSTKRSAKGAPARKSAPARKGTRTSTGKQGTPRGLAQETEPSPELASIVGNKPMPRTQVTKKVWDYIKSHNLQDPKNRRMINADDKLKPLFGGKRQASMFELTKMVSRHLKEVKD